MAKVKDPDSQNGAHNATMSGSSSPGPENRDRASTEGKKSIIGRLLPLIVIAAALALVFATGVHQYLSLEALQDNRDWLHAQVEENRVRTIAIFIAVYAVAVAISLPGASLLTIFGGFLFGPVYGSAAVVFAATLGALGIFLAAKGALADLLGSKASGFIAKLEAGFREDELSYMFVLRLIPIVPFWAVNIAAGVLGVRTHSYLIATFFGIMPGSIVYASIGNGVGAAFDAGQAPNLSGVLLQPAILFPIIGLVLLAIFPIIYRKFFQKNKTGASV